MVLFGTPLAYLLARGRLPLARIVELGIMLPLMMPPLVIGLLLIFLIGPEGTLGNLLADIHLTGVNTFFALIVAEFYEAAPFYVLGAHAAFSSVDPRIEQDATLLGDRPLQAFRRITLPLAAPGLATGLATAWARAMGAFGAVIIVAYYPPRATEPDIHRLPRVRTARRAPLRSPARCRSAPPPDTRLPVERADSCPHRRGR